MNEESGFDEPLVALKDAEKDFVQEQAGRELFGQALSPYTPARMTAAQSMGLLYPFVGEDGERRVKLNGTYPGMMMDGIIVCWLCTLMDDLEARGVKPPPEWTPMKALRRPSEAIEAALNWAGEKRVTDVTNEAYTEAMVAFASIMNSAGNAQFTIDVEQLPNVAGSKVSSGDSGGPKV